MRRWIALFGAFLAVLLFAPWATEPIVANDVDPPAWDHVNVDQHTVLPTGTFSLKGLEHDNLGGAVTSSATGTSHLAITSALGTFGNSRASPAEAETFKVNFDRAGYAGDVVRNIDGTECFIGNDAAGRPRWADARCTGLSH